VDRRANGWPWGKPRAVGRPLNVDVCPGRCQAVRATVGTAARSLGGSDDSKFWSSGEPLYAGVDGGVGEEPRSWDLAEGVYNLRVELCAGAAFELLDRRLC
jgi:hypothetical protein